MDNEPWKFAATSTTLLFVQEARVRVQQRRWQAIANIMAPCISFGTCQPRHVRIAGRINQSRDDAVRRKALGVEQIRFARRREAAPSQPRAAVCEASIDEVRSPCGA